MTVATTEATCLQEVNAGSVCAQLQVARHVRILQQVDTRCLEEMCQHRHRVCVCAARIIDLQIVCCVLHVVATTAQLLAYMRCPDYACRILTAQSHTLHGQGFRSSGR
jgi:hypothetical protein